MGANGAKSFQDLGQQPIQPLQPLTPLSKPAQMFTGQRNAQNRATGDFFTSSYLPHAERDLRPSTYNGYKGAWERYVEERAFALLWIREVRTHHVQELLEEVARIHKVGKRTLQHLKHLLSGVFRYAAQQDYLDAGRNPVTMASIPGFAPSGSETGAYSLEEVKTMLSVLTDPALTAVSVAAFAGLRAGEIRGLEWDAYEPSSDTDSLGLIYVRRSIWRKHVTDPKTVKSRAAVPVIPQLAEQLERWRQTCGNPTTGPIFPNAANKPLSLDALYWWSMRTVLEGARVKWCGWHGFRRGLASNLNRLGVDDSVIQAILRHSHIGVTQACYIKTVRPEIEAAMKNFSDELRKCSPLVLENDGSKPSRMLQ
jgi:integrase